MICDHHFCSREVLYGGKNKVVVARLGDNADPGKVYQGVLCCKCHKLMVIPQGESFPAESTSECKDRWKEYNRKIDEYIKIHGPMGG